MSSKLAAGSGAEVKAHQKAPVSLFSPLWMQIAGKEESPHGRAAQKQRGFTSASRCRLGGLRRHPSIPRRALAIGFISAAISGGPLARWTRMQTEKSLGVCPGAMGHLVARPTITFVRSGWQKCNPPISLPLASCVPLPLDKSGWLIAPPLLCPSFNSDVGHFTFITPNALLLNVIWRKGPGEYGTHTKRMGLRRRVSATRQRGYRLTAIIEARVWY